MMASRYLATFETEVTAWQKALSMVAEVLLILNDIQRTWSYLEPLFIGSEEVKKELPETAEKFASIDMNVKGILAEAWTTRNVKAACNRPGLYEELEKLAERLEQCKKALSEYLDGKRRIFPRFYFVSEADLLDILSNGNTPSRIIHHITKVLLATATLELDESRGGRPFAKKFISSVGVEEVALEPHVRLEGKVEIYLQTVLDGQKLALKNAVQVSMDRFQKQERIAWIMDKTEAGKPTDPAQIMLVVAGTGFVRDVETAFDNMLVGEAKAMSGVYDNIVRELKELVKQTHKPLDRANRQRVMTQITMDAHSRDVVLKLVRDNVTSKTSFRWQSQLKQVYRNGEIVLTNLDAAIAYGYEYLGNGPRLVVTPLTDRIYVTATQALNLKMGCAPAGPAGTGKTETTKDLANACSTALRRWTTSPWGASSRVLLHLEAGAVSMSLTGWCQKCCPCARCSSKLYWTASVEIATRAQWMVMKCPLTIRVLASSR
jgi:dynein heavy chain, axonemal